MAEENVNDSLNESGEPKGWGEFRRRMLDSDQPAHTVRTRFDDPRYYPVEPERPAYPAEKLRKYAAERQVTSSRPEQPPGALPSHLWRRYRCVDEYADWGNPASWSDQMLEDWLPDVR